MRYQFVDCRWELGNPARGRELYLAGHIPGASFLDVDEDLAAPPGERGRHPLPDAGDFAVAASRAGIEDGVFVVAYGVAGGAERLWWLLRHFGHDEVAVLRGGIEGWRGPLRAGTEEIEAARFVPRLREGDTIEAEELAARLERPRRCSCSMLAFRNASAESRTRSTKCRAAIPGARNLPHTVDEPIPDDVLAAEEIVAYCGSGVTACVTLFALSEAGRPDAKLYPGSWSEWEGLGLPLERG